MSSSFKNKSNNNPKVAIFGCSWSDAYYNDHTDYRHKTWSEYFYDHNPNIKVYNFAISGTSLDFAIASMTQLLGTKNKIDNLDAILFEIPPIHRFWQPITDIVWTDGWGLNESRDYEEQRKEPFHDPVPENYESKSVYNKDSYFVSIGSYLKYWSKTSSEQPWRTYQKSEYIEDWIDWQSKNTHQFNSFKNATMISSLQHMEKMLNVPIYTMSFVPLDYDHLSWQAKLTNFFQKDISGGYYPSNIGLDSVLNEYLIHFPNKRDKEWWADDAHPSCKGNKWICDNILMKNDIIRNLVMGNTLDTNQNK